MFNYASLGKDIEDVLDSDVYKYLNLADYMTDMFRSFGQFIFNIFASIGDVLNKAFDEIIKIDFATVLDFGLLQVTLNELAWYLLVIVVLLTLIILPFKKNKDIGIMKNVIVVILSICLYSQFYTYMMGIYTQGIQIANQIFDRKDVTISEMIYRDNTYDMLKSLKNNKLEKVSKNIPIQGIYTKEILSKNDLQGMVKYDDEGNMTIDDLSDGVLNSGFMEERYYRYDIDYLSINITTILTDLFLIIGAIKVAYIGIQLFFMKLFGGVVMSVGITKLDRVVKVFSEIVNSVVSMLLVYVGLMIFIKGTPQIMNLDINWLSKIIILGVFGFMFLLGDMFLKTFGQDTGSMFIMKSMFASRMMKRGIDNIGKPLSNMYSNVGKKFKNFKFNENPNFEKQFAQGDFNNNSERQYNGLENKSFGIEDDGKEKPLYGFDNGNAPTFDPNRQIDGDKNPNEKLYGYDDGRKPSFNNPGDVEEKPMSKILDKNASEELKVKSYEEYKRDYAKGDNSVYKQYAPKANPALRKDFETVFKYPLTNREALTVESWEKKYGKDMTSYALREADLYEKRDMGYINNVLRSWESKGFSASDIEEDKHRIRKKSPYDDYE